MRPHQAADVNQQEQKSAAAADNICQGYFLPHANAVEAFLPEAEHGVCVQSERQSLRLLISYLLIYECVE